MQLSFDRYPNTRTARLWFGEAWMSKGLALSLYRASSIGQELFIGGDDGEIGVSVYAGLVGATLKVTRASRFYERKATGWHAFLNEGATFADRFWDALLTLQLHSDDNYDWRHRTFSPFRWVVGSSSYEEQEVDRFEAGVVVPMPEGNYPARVVINKVRWTRPRWFSTPWFWRAEIEIPGGIPLPGKGDNSWDCDDDATFAITFAIENYPPRLNDVLFKTMVDVLQSRQRRAGHDWVPDKGWPAHMQPRSRS